MGTSSRKLGATAGLSSSAYLRYLISMKELPLHGKGSGETSINRAYVHELTFSCYRRLQLLTDDMLGFMLAESIDLERDACMSTVNSICLHA